MLTRSSRVVVAIIAACIVAACALTQVVPPSNAGSSCAGSLSSTEFNGWFDSGTASLNGSVKPANSVLFPDVPNCSFYKWSEQMFLWLTSPAPPRYGSAGSLVMNTPAFFDLSLPDANEGRTFEPHVAGTIRAFNLRTAQHGFLDLPIVLEARTLRILEVIPPSLSGSGLPLVADANGNEVAVADVRVERDRAPVLVDPSGKPIASTRALLRARNPQLRPLDRKLAAFDGFDRSSLVEKIAFKDRFALLDLIGDFHEAEQGQADGGVLMAQNGSLVYYSLTVNNVFALYRTMQGNTVPANTRFPLTQADLNAITGFATAHGRGPVIDSEALSIEIKTSWVEADGLLDADKFIQMNAIVPSYDKTNPSDWAPNGTRTVRLAMVGMHITGSTGSTNPSNTNHGHPELLWATFEHVSNGPAAQYSYATLPSGNTTVAQNTTGNWVFSASGAAAPFNQQHREVGGPHKDHIVALPGFTISPSNILRKMPWGLPGTTSGGNAEVIAINGTVRSLLDPADIRRNDFHEGTTWTIFGGAPSGGNQVGTNKLENTTMETFNQGGNCFDCHGTNTTAVSHVFNNTKPLF